MELIGKKNLKEKSSKLTQQELMKMFHYDTETGIFTRLITINNYKAKAGQIAGSTTAISRKQYLRVSIKNKFYLCHRLAWLYVHGEFPENEIDHIDGNGLNNRISNLRHVIHEVNGRNQKLNKNNTSGYCGVTWDKQRSRWASQIKHGGINRILGRFENILEAVAARKEAETEYGFHVNHGQR